VRASSCPHPHNRILADSLLPDHLMNILGRTERTFRSLTASRSFGSISHTFPTFVAFKRSAYRTRLLPKTAAVPQEPSNTDRLCLVTPHLRQKCLSLPQKEVMKRRTSQGRFAAFSRPGFNSAEMRHSLKNHYFSLPVSGRIAPFLLRALAASPGTPSLCPPKHPFSPPAVVYPRLPDIQLPATLAA
jgi:hypothetical protein